MFREPNVGAYQGVYVYQGWANTEDCGPAVAATLINQSKRYRFIGKEQCRAQIEHPAWWRTFHVMDMLKRYGVDCSKQTLGVKRTAGVYLVKYGWWFSHWVIAWTVKSGEVTVLDTKRGLYTMTLRNFTNIQRSSSVIETDLIF